MARSRRWSASEDIFSAQLSRVSIRYVLYLHALCIRLNAVWGAICIPLTHSLSLHLYLQYICGIYGEYRYILQQLPKTQLRTAAQAALCIQLFMHRQLDLSGCLGIPHPPFPFLSHSFPYARTKHMRQYIKRGDWQEAQHQRQHQHQSTEALPSVGNNFN